MEWLKSNSVAIIIALCSCFASYTGAVMSVTSYKQQVVQNSEELKKIQNTVQDLDIRERDIRLQVSILKTSQSAYSESVVKLAATQDKLYESVNSLNQAIAKLSAQMEYNRK
jgi:sensor histidine kinase YesM